ncbi:TPA: TIGR03757 family integrating conjugative element protein [Salmonella enterica subsp. diarizonae serovar 61:l,v:z35]|nr:TIGR03757 family integrating conjugative element protein [Salmonella enterica subsp. diarizonae serovar 61:l,v:z35]HCT3101046.1 TIGR03757 family integrating conjugative element protein [Salmonella enterica subsp. diarizonae serovar 61:l,v:z35]
MQHYFFTLFPFLFLTSVPVPAQTVIFTTARYPVENQEPGVVIQVLEDIHSLEQSLFPALSQHPEQAEQQAREQMKQPDWREQEARLTRAYQSLLDAYALGVEKVPAVVLDEKYVVYGTTDIRVAEKKRDTWQETQP